MNITLRPWNLSDIDSLVEYANNPKIAQNLTNGFPHPYTREAGEKFIAHATSGAPPNILAIEIEGRASGGIGIHPQQDIMCRNAELGYWLAEPFWGKGIMSAAVRQMVKYGFDNFPEIHRIFARPFGTNIASSRVLEKAGFSLEARLEGTILKNGVVQDELIYAIRRK